MTPIARTPAQAATLVRAYFLGLLCCATTMAENALPEVERLKSSPVLQHLKPNPVSNSSQPSPGEKTVAQMHVPEGFRVDLVLAEPDLHQPVAFTFDEKGRMWVIEAYSYPSKRAPGEGLDKVCIFEDRDGNGTFETRKVFAQGLNLASAIEVGHGGAWIGAAPELLFIPDLNKDDVPDGPPQILLDGFGFQDTHECLNSFLWGPDGWLYGNQGVFNHARIGKPGTPDAERIELRAGVWRYHPQKKQFEVFAHGGSNPWGLDYDERGQIFMTHCRSYWGKGPTTHVIQGGHFWNQANANHQPFIVARPPSAFPGFQNFLLSSARYDHGAGGAGQPGSDAIYGGHSHVGAMIYLGDNWPDEFRGHLFTHNLGGHQMNHQINQRLGSGFNTVHAGKDQLFCTDPKYVAVDLQYGPDGAVYVIDWYDQQHCHNPNTERWDRSNGRVYRIQYQAGYLPKKPALSELSDAALVGLQSHKNEWWGRTARRILQERAALRPVEPTAAASLSDTLKNQKDPAARLKALWTLLACHSISPAILDLALSDPDEYVRSWAIQIGAQEFPENKLLGEKFKTMAGDEKSAVVRLYLASAAQRLSQQTAWPILESLARRGEDAGDRNIPLLLWHSIAPLFNGNLDKAFSLAKSTAMPQLADSIYWFAATLDSKALERSVSVLNETGPADLDRRLAGLWLALEPRANVAMPVSWRAVSPKLYTNDNPVVKRQAERIAAAFGDESIFPELRLTLSRPGADLKERKHAFEVLSRAQDLKSVPVFLKLLEEDSFRSPAINLLAQFDRKEISDALLENYSKFSDPERAATLNALTGRPSFALALIDAVADGKINRDRLSSFHIRQLSSLKNRDVDARLEKVWGRIHQTPVEKENLIQKLQKTFDEAPLWAFESSAGRKHFQTLCAGCHRIGNDGVQLGPELTGAGKHGVRYFLENIIDPDAVIGSDFQMTTIETKDGRLVSGLLIKETGTAFTIRTTAEELVIAKTEVVRRETSLKSMMPEALLESLNDREKLELLKYLVTH